MLATGLEQPPEQREDSKTRTHLLMALSTAALLAQYSPRHCTPNQTPPGSLERLGQSKTTGAPPNIPTIPPTGPKADSNQAEPAEDQAANRIAQTGRRGFEIIKA